jgi:D-glycerate 3-kinase
LRLALAELGLRAVDLSLDDLYYTRAERRRLSRSVHPLLITRGVPGTHDLALARRTLSELCAATAGARVAYPRFDKARDDRLPRARWPRHTGPTDVVLFEGWCLGCPAQAERELARPLNALERDDDGDAAFRRYVNAQLAGSYAELFSRCRRLVFLRVPDLACVRRWRAAQERQLPHAALSGPALERFIQHFERLTRHMLDALPASADVCIELAADHSVAGTRLRAQQRMGR